MLPYEIPVSLSHALSQDTCRSRRRKGTFKSFPPSEQEREGSLAPRWMGDVEAPGAGCFGLLGAWETWGQGDVNVCLGEPLMILERGPIRGDAGSAARQLHGEEAVGPVVGAKIEALSVPHSTCCPVHEGNVRD